MAPPGFDPHFYSQPGCSAVPQIDVYCGAAIASTVCCGLCPNVRSSVGGLLTQKNSC